MLIGKRFKHFHIMELRGSYMASDKILAIFGDWSKCQLSYLRRYEKSHHYPMLPMQLLSCTVWINDNSFLKILPIIHSMSILDYRADDAMIWSRTISLVLRCLSLQVSVGIYFAFLHASLSCLVRITRTNSGTLASLLLFFSFLFLKCFDTLAIH